MGDSIHGQGQRGNDAGRSRPGRTLPGGQPGQAGKHHDDSAESPIDRFQKEPDRGLQPRQDRAYAATQNSRPDEGRDQGRGENRGQDTGGIEDAEHRQGPGTCGCLGGQGRRKSPGRQGGNPGGKEIFKGIGEEYEPRKGQVGQLEGELPFDSGPQQALRREGRAKAGRGAGRPSGQACQRRVGSHHRRPYERGLGSGKCREGTGEYEGRYQGAPAAEDGRRQEGDQRRQYTQVLAGEGKHMGAAGFPESVGKVEVQVVSGAQHQGLQKRAALPSSPAQGSQHPQAQAGPEPGPSTLETPAFQVARLREEYPARAAPVLDGMPANPKEGAGGYRATQPGDNDGNTPARGGPCPVPRPRRPQAERIEPSPSTEGDGILRCRALHPFHQPGREPKGGGSPSFLAAPEGQEGQ